MDRRHDRGAWATLGLLALPIICCGAPALVAAGTFAAVGGWLGAHGYWLVAGGILAVAAGVAARWWTRRRRCALAPPTTARERG